MVTMNNTIEIIQNWDETKDGHIRARKRRIFFSVSKVIFMSSMIICCNSIFVIFLQQRSKEKKSVAAGK